MSYYPVPDIPDGAPPEVRRFCEQVRSVVGALEKLGQPIDVHEFIAGPPNYNATLILDEIPVYRSDAATELLHATWTVPFSESVHHDMNLYRRGGDGGSTRELVAQIASAGGSTTDWSAFKPKEFSETKTGRKLARGNILTLEIAEQVAAGTEPWGLLSMYLRRVEAA